jgi:acetyl-CoA decarbonylase/synthase, CODH/ACS complex subunit gamma
MALTGIQIFQLLPKTNCGDCGVPTCLAFAMNLAAGKGEIDQCPHVTDDAKTKLSEESAPPIRTVEFGTGDNVVKVGGETVLFRHEKTFFNKTGLGVLISDDEADDSVAGKIERLAKLQYDRVGLLLRGEIIAAKAVSGDAGKYEALVKKIVDGSDAAIILMADSKDMIEAGLKAAKDRKPLIYAATKDNIDDFIGLAKDNALPLAIKGANIDEQIELADKALAAGLKDLVIDPGSRDIKQVLIDNIAARRKAIKEKVKGLGFPTIMITPEMTDNPMKEALYASIGIAKYAGIVILSDNQGETLFPLLLERLNIYTDPQRPMKTDPGIYEFNGPGPDSPVLITCNFSLTYFIVSGEIEASRVPTYLLVLDTDGLSVLTGWAAGKFVGDAVGPFIKSCGIEDKVTNKCLVLPGALAVLSGDVEEELGSDWKVMIGPREAAHIPAFLKKL